MIAFILVCHLKYPLNKICHFLCSGFLTSQMLVWLTEDPFKLHIIWLLLLLALHAPLLEVALPRKLNVQQRHISHAYKGKAENFNGSNKPGRDCVQLRSTSHLSGTASFQLGLLVALVEWVPEPCIFFPQNPEIWVSTWVLHKS